LTVNEIIINQSVYCAITNLIIYITDAIKEYEVFIKFYGKLQSVLSVDTLPPYLFGENLLNINEVKELSTIPTRTRKAVYVLRKILSSLQAGQTQSFYMFLSILEEHGNASSLEVVSEMKFEIIESFKGNYVLKPYCIHHSKDYTYLKVCTYVLL